MNERDTLLAFIRRDDMNGFLTLEGDETLEQLREAVAALERGE